MLPPETMSFRSRKLEKSNGSRKIKRRRARRVRRTRRAQVLSLDPRPCQFCADKTISIDYKKADMLRRFISDDGKIRPRRQTGTCARHQRVLAGAIKRARHIALLPFTGSRFEDGSR